MCLERYQQLNGLGTSVLREPASSTEHPGPLAVHLTTCFFLPCFVSLPSSCSTSHLLWSNLHADLVYQLLLRLEALSAPLLLSISSITVATHSHNSPTHPSPASPLVSEHCCFSSESAAFCEADAGGPLPDPRVFAPSEGSRKSHASVRYLP